MTKGLKRGGIAIGVVAVIIAVGVALFDWNMLRGFIERRVTESTGRELVIGGDLQVDLGFTSRISVENIRFANADWGTAPTMVAIDRLEFSLHVPALFKGDIVLPEIALSSAQVHLEKSRTGEPNWVFDKDEPDKPTQLPVIKRLRVDDGRLRYRDPAQDTDLKVELDTDSASTQAMALSARATGRFRGAQAQASGRGGSVLLITDAQRPYPFDVEIQAGATKATIAGTVTGIAEFDAMNVRLDLRGDSLASLYPLAKISLPPTPPYRIRGRLVHETDTWSMQGLTGTVGDSDLSGDVVFATGGEKPLLQAKLVSRVLDIDDLGGLIGAPPETGAGETASPGQEQAAEATARKTRVLPDKKFDLDRLRAMNADVKFAGKSIKGRSMPLDDLSAHLLLEDGRLTLKPLNFGVAGGNVVSTIVLDGRRAIPAVDADVQIRNVFLNELFPTVELTKSSVGRFGGSAKLRAQGGSFADWLASADGDMGIVMAKGEISNLILELVGLDAAESLRYWFKDENIEIRCAVGAFGVTDGVMDIEAFVIDTEDTNVSADGTINLGKETLDITLHPLPKGPSILSVRGPLYITGTFKDPKFRPDVGTLVSRGGAAVLLGLVNPLLALLPLLETGPGQNSDCRALIDKALH